MKCLYSQFIILILFKGKRREKNVISTVLLNEYMVPSKLTKALKLSPNEV